jgi:hypothetical protein
MSNKIVVLPNGKKVIRVKSVIQYHEKDPLWKDSSSCSKCCCANPIDCNMLHPTGQTQEGKFWCDKKVFGKWVAFHFEKI